MIGIEITIKDVKGSIMNILTNTPSIRIVINERWQISEIVHNLDIYYEGPND